MSISRGIRIHTLAGALVFLLSMAWAETTAAEPAAKRLLIVAPDGLRVPVSGAMVFRSLTELARSIACVTPGDEILLEGGREFTGRLRLAECPASGPNLSSGEVIVRSFHPEAPADAAAAVANAVVRAAPSAAELGLVWQREITPSFRGKSLPQLTARVILKIGPFPHPVAQVFLRDARLPLAAFPSATSTASSYVAVSGIRAEGDGCPARACLDIADETALGALRELERIEGSGAMNAQVIVRNSPWSLARATVRHVGFVPGKAELRLAQTVFGPGHSTRSPPLAGHGVMLVNSFAFLDESREWYYNPDDRHVYLHWDPDVAVPQPGTTRFSMREDSGGDRLRFDDAGIAIAGLTGKQPGRIGAARIQGVTIKQATGSGVRVRSTGSAVITGVEAWQSGARGIAIVDVRESAIITGNRIESSGGTGIGVHAVPRVEITSNVVREPGYIGGQPVLDMDFMGIRLDGAYSSAVIASNRISDSGYAGIVTVDPVPDAPGIRQPVKLHIRDNEISRFCGLLNDCAAIYINGRGRDPADLEHAITYGKLIAGNRISIPIGNTNGTPGSMGFSPEASGGRPVGAWQRLIGAIYLDHRASYFDVRDNTVSGQYGPYSWLIRHRAVENACDRTTVERCVASYPGAVGDREAFRCYSRSLNQCNDVEQRSRQ